MRKILPNKKAQEANPISNIVIVVLVLAVLFIFIFFLPSIIKYIQRINAAGGGETNIGDLQSNCLIACQQISVSPANYETVKRPVIAQNNTKFSATCRELEKSWCATNGVANKSSDGSCSAGSIKIDPIITTPC